MHSDSLEILSYYCCFFLIFSPFDCTVQFLITRRQLEFIVRHLGSSLSPTQISPPVRLSAETGVPDRLSSSSQTGVRGQRYGCYTRLSAMRAWRQQLRQSSGSWRCWSRLVRSVQALVLDLYCKPLPLRSQPLFHLVDQASNNNVVLAGILPKTSPCEWPRS